MTPLVVLLRLLRWRPSTLYSLTFCCTLFSECAQNYGITLGLPSTHLWLGEIAQYVMDNGTADYMAIITVTVFIVDIVTPPTNGQYGPYMKIRIGDRTSGSKMFDITFNGAMCRQWHTTLQRGAVYTMARVKAQVFDGVKLFTTPMTKITLDGTSERALQLRAWSQQELATAAAAAGARGMPM